MKIQDTDKLLIVSPHPDDESIGCGGLLALYGRQCDVLLLTDGRRGKSQKRINCSDDEIIETRLGELKNALHLCSVHELITLNIPDSELKQHRKIVFASDISQYDYIFIPNSHEEHPDHYYACRYIKWMRLIGKTKAKIYEYEVWTPLRSVDWLLDISSVEHIKKQMIEQHVSQLECMDYLSSGMGLSHYRGIGCRSSAAEAFYRSPASITDKAKRLVHWFIDCVRKKA